MAIRTAKAAGVRSHGRAAIAARTLRTDRSWAYPVVTFTVLAAFVAYATYAALANRDYYAAPYISPFYSPCLSFHCGLAPGSHGAPHLAWFDTWWIVTPAVFILIFPLGFRLTCYYYRKAYYRSWWLSPPACAVPEPRRRYTGETRPAPGRAAAWFPGFPGHRGNGRRRRADHRPRSRTRR